MELLSSYDGFLIIDSTVFGQTAQITIVENTWDDGLADHSVSLEIDQAGRQVVELGHIDRAELLKALDIMVSLSEAGELVR